MYYEVDFWKQFSPEAHDLVIRMTNKDQYQRISASECLQHKWLNMLFKKGKGKHLPIASSNTDFSEAAKFSLIFTILFRQNRKKVSEKFIPVKSKSPRAISKMSSERQMDITPVLSHRSNTRTAHRKVNIILVNEIALSRKNKEILA